ATDSTLSLPSVTSGDAGGYSAVVSNAFGSVTSSVAVLTVISVPVITNAPSGSTNPAGTTVIFKVAATGALPLNYQWFKNGNSLTDGGRISGSTGTTLTISNTLGADAGSYTVAVGNGAGSVTSSPPAVLVVIDPVVTGQPLSRTNIVGTSANFAVT